MVMRYHISLSTWNSIAVNILSHFYCMNSTKANMNNGIPNSFNFKWQSRQKLMQWTRSHRDGLGRVCVSTVRHGWHRTKWKLMLMIHENAVNGFIVCVAHLASTWLCRWLWHFPQHRLDRFNRTCIHSFTFARNRWHNVLVNCISIVRNSMFNVRN